jgi:hypothetical protein
MWAHGGRRSPEGLRYQRADWMSDGLCRTLPGTPKERVDVFFERERYGNDRTALLCGRCPVRTECADYAWENGIEYGTFGGVSEHQRRKGTRYMVVERVKPTTQPPPLVERVLAMHRSGMKWRAITRETGLHARTIFKLVNQDRKRAS